MGSVENTRKNFIYNYCISNLWSHGGFFTGGVKGFFFGGIAGMCPEGWAAVINSFGYILVSWLFLYFLYRKKTFLKI